MAVKVRRFYETVLHVDDPDAPGLMAKVPLKVKRLSLEEMSDFKRDYQRLADPPSNRLIFVRKPEGEEQERNEKGEFVVPLEVVSQRRLVEMTPEQRVEYDTLDAEDEKFAKVFITRAIVNYTQVPTGELEDEEGTPITTGADLVRMFGSRRDILLQLIVSIWAENTLSASEKKVQRSLFDLKASLNQSLLEVLGQKQAPIAEPAENAASVETGGVTGLETTLSGSEALPSHS